jgi:hypothetical protein
MPYRPPEPLPGRETLPRLSKPAEVFHDLPTPAVRPARQQQSFVSYV